MAKLNEVAATLFSIYSACYDPNTITLNVNQAFIPLSDVDYINQLSPLHSISSLVMTQMPKKKT